jgi:hypothetical protein
MTNLAPVFGVRIDQAHITASANYFDVILFHGVIVFLGPFLFWALAMKRYDFSSFASFLIFGLSGLWQRLHSVALHQFLNLDSGYLSTAL